MRRPRLRLQQHITERHQLLGRGQLADLLSPCVRARHSAGLLAVTGVAGLQGDGLPSQRRQQRPSDGRRSGIGRLQPERHLLAVPGERRASDRTRRYDVQWVNRPATRHHTVLPVRPSRRQRHHHRLFRVTDVHLQLQHQHQHRLWQRLARHHNRRRPFHPHLLSNHHRHSLHRHLVPSPSQLASRHHTTLPAQPRHPRRSGRRRRLYSDFDRIQCGVVWNELLSVGDRFEWVDHVRCGCNDGVFAWAVP